MQGKKKCNKSTRFRGVVRHSKAIEDLSSKVLTKSEHRERNISNGTYIAKEGLLACHKQSRKLFVFSEGIVVSSKCIDNRLNVNSFCQNHFLKKRKR